MCLIWHCQLFRNSEPKNFSEHFASIWLSTLSLTWTGRHLSKLFGLTTFKVFKSGLLFFPGLTLHSSIYTLNPKQTWLRPCLPDLIILLMLFLPGRICSPCAPVNNFTRLILRHSSSVFYCKIFLDPELSPNKVWSPFCWILLTFWPYSSC